MLFISYLHHPFYQFLLMQMFFVLVLIIVRPDQLEKVWVTAGVHYIVFILLNGVMCWFAKAVWMYFLYSMVFSVLFLLCTSGLINLYSNWKYVEGSGESSMIFLVIIYHPFVLLAVMLVRWVFIG